jgi:hypothetical protein
MPGINLNNLLKEIGFSTFFKSQVNNEYIFINKYFKTNIKLKEKVIIKYYKRNNI